MNSEDENINDYIDKRLNNQIKWYDKKAISCRKWHEIICIICIIESSVAAFMITLAQTFISISTVFIITSAICSSSISVLLAIDKLKKFQDLHYQYRGTCEKLKQEKELFITKSGDYFIPNGNKDLSLFIERCESIMTTEVGNWAQLNEKKQSN